MNKEIRELTNCVIKCFIEMQDQQLKFDNAMETAGLNKLTQEQTINLIVDAQNEVCALVNDGLLFFGSQEDFNGIVIDKFTNKVFGDNS